MQSLFDPSTVGNIKGRIDRLRLDSPRQWGRMTPAQALAHCAATMELAVGDQKPPRMFVGRLLGPLVKNKALGPEPMRKNAPTDKRLIVTGDPGLDAERRRLVDLIDRFWASGADGCTTHPHTFFGPLTPDEWAVLMYKHLDHHLRQFGA
jgi:hypothetical protein